MSRWKDHRPLALCELSYYASLGVLLIVVSLLFSGCGRISNRTSTGPGTPEASATSEMDARLADLDTAISGTAKEKSAGQYLANRALNEPIQACMKDLGYPYDYHFVDQWIGTVDPGGSSETSTAPLMATTTSSDAQGTLDAFREEQRLEAATPEAGSIKDSPGYAKALDQCEPDSNYAEQTSPEGAMALASDLNEVVMGVEEKMGPTEPYDVCMANAGYDVVFDDVDGYQGLQVLLQSQLPASDLIPEPGESGTDQWQDFLAYEHAALQVDMNCRGQQHAEAMALLDPQLDQFEKEHADDISRLRTEWQQLVVQASAAGWNADGASQDH